MFGESSAKAMFGVKGQGSKWDETLSQMEKAYGFLRESDAAVMYARMPFITEIK